MAGFNQKTLAELLEKTEKNQGYVEYYSIPEQAMGSKTAGAWGIPMSEQRRPVPYVNADGVEGFVLLNANEDYPLYHAYPASVFEADPVFSHKENPLTERLEKEERIKAEFEARAERKREKAQQEMDATCKSLLDNMGFINSHFGNVFNIEEEQRQARENQQAFLRNNLFKKFIVERYAKTFRNSLEQIEMKEGNLNAISGMSDVGSGNFMNDLVEIDNQLSALRVEVSFGFKIDVQYVDLDGQYDFILKDRDGQEVARESAYAEMQSDDYDGEGSELFILSMGDHREDSPLYEMINSLTKYAYLENADPANHYELIDGKYPVKSTDILTPQGVTKLLLESQITAQGIKGWMDDRSQNGAKGHQRQADELSF